MPRDENSVIEARILYRSN